MARIRLERVGKVFNGTVHAVQDVEMVVEDGAVVCLLGPSGCGKTTTMRMIAGLESPTSGRIFFDDQDVTDLSAHDRNVAMVFQFPAVYPHVTVFENIAMALRAERMAESRIRTTVEEVAARLHIEATLPTKAGRVDSSTKQKIAIARAIVRSPEVFLFDEPLSNIDPSARAELKATIKELSAELKQTFIYVTHDQSEAMTLADRIAVMKDGRLLQYDVPEQLYDQPADTFIGWFLGNPGMNFIAARVTPGPDGPVLTDSLFRMQAAEVGVTGLEAGRAVTIGIRPEHVEVFAGPRPQADGWVQATCRMVEPLGGQNILHIEAGDTRLRAKSVGVGREAEDRPVWVRVSPEHVRLFDTASGQRIA